MTVEPDKAGEPGTEAVDEVRRGRGRPTGRRDRQPRKTAVHSAFKIIQAASRAGYDGLTIDTDGKITLQKTRPADSAGDNGEQNEWDTVLKSDDQAGK